MSEVPDRVLVPLSREAAARYLGGDLRAEDRDRIDDALRAALDTDREELEALVIRAMMNVGKVKPTFGDYAGAVLAVLEGVTE